MFNNLFVAVVETAAIVVIGAMAGYALGRLEFRGRKVLYNAVIYQMIFPGVMKKCFILGMFFILPIFTLYREGCVL